MKYFTLICLTLFSFIAFAQEHVVFERSEKTEHFFDESNPFSLLSIVQQNAHYLSYFYLRGMDVDAVDDLTLSEKASTSKFLGPQSDVPLTDEYGDVLIRTNPDGTQEYVYPAPDSMFIDLYGIDKIVFTLHDGDAEPMARLNDLQLWKEYESGMKRTATLDAEAFMKFDGLNFILPLSKDESNKLINQSRNASLWSTLKDSSLSEMKWFEDRMIDGVFIEEMGYAQSYLLSHFPFVWRLLPNFPDELRSKSEIEPLFRPDFYYENSFPFSTELTESVNNGTASIEELQRKFDDIHFILSKEMIPLIDEYGDPVLEMDENGIMQPLYPEPSEVYFFLDYEPTIFVTKSIRCDSGSNCLLTPSSIFFCLNNGNQNVELVSELPIDMGRKQEHFLDPLLTDFKPTELTLIPEIMQIKSSINEKKYRKELSFNESTIPCETCSNKKGKYALCWKGKRKTKYKFERAPIALKDGTFIAKDKELTYLLDAKAVELFSAELDSIHTASDLKGVYFGQRNDHWMIYSKNGEYTLPMTYIPNGYEIFRLKKYLTTQVDGKYFVSTGKNGKKGVIDTKGNVLIPFEFIELYADSTFGETSIDGDWRSLTRAVGKINAESEWIIFDEGFKANASLKANDYFGTYGDLLLFLSGNQMEAYHALTLARDESVFSSKPETHVFKGHKKGIVNSKGHLIIPAKYEFIRRETFDERVFYFCSSFDDQFDIYDTLGLQLGGFEDVDYYSKLCSEFTNFIQASSPSDGNLIIWFNENSNHFEKLFDEKLRSIMCTSGGLEEPFATGVIVKSEDKKTYNLFRDGRMEAIEE